MAESEYSSYAVAEYVEHKGWRESMTYILVQDLSHSLNFTRFLSFIRYSETLGILFEFTDSIRVRGGLWSL